MQPASLAVAQIAFDRSDGFRASQMNVGGFPAHVISEFFFVAFLGERLHLNVAAIRSQAPSDPMRREMDVGIANAHCALDKFPAQNMGCCQTAGPDPRRRRQLFGFANHMGAIPGCQAEHARMAQTAKTGDARFHFVV